MKKCGSCKKIKPVTEYYKRADTPDGLYTMCKACHRSIRKKSYYNNIETDRAYKKAEKARIDADPHLRAIRAAKSRLDRALRRRGIKRVAPYFDLLGCTPEQYIEHLKATKNKLTWCSYSDQWVVRQTLPPRTFNLKDPDQQFALFNVTNQFPAKVGNE